MAEPTGDDCLEGLGRVTVALHSAIPGALAARLLSRRDSTIVARHEVPG
jgi:hypothetical protein